MNKDMFIDDQISKKEEELKIMKAFKSNKNVFYSRKDSSDPWQLIINCWYQFDFNNYDYRVEE